MVEILPRCTLDVVVAPQMCRVVGDDGRWTAANPAIPTPDAEEGLERCFSSDPHRLFHPDTGWPSSLQAVKRPASSRPLRSRFSARTVKSVLFHAGLLPPRSRVSVESGEKGRGRPGGCVTPPFPGSLSLCPQCRLSSFPRPSDNRFDPSLLPIAHSAANNGCCRLVG